jgi:drug/metabolite transporter (DMT)-like permease
VPQILGHSSFNWALRRLSATFVAGSVLGEAIGSTMLAWWLLAEAPPALTVAGGSLILAGLVVAAREERRTSRLAA